jgi:3-phosphoshikimate 1-carboxyvinyltransferase
MDLVFAPARGLSGTVRVPGDKSVTHRAYLLAACARGTTRIRGANEGADCLATLAALAALGVRHALEDEGVLALHGRPDGFDPPAHALDLGNSGTAMRLLLGLLAGRGTPATLTGDASLARRPMARVVDPLRAMGADVSAHDGKPPLVVRPAALTGQTHVLRVASAQVKSCLLLAGLFARGATRVEEPLPSRDHTERMLAAFGVALERPEARTCIVHGPVALRSPGEVTVPGDFSAAFFWMVGATIAGEGELTIEGVGLNPTRTGGLAVLRRMGAAIEVRNERAAGGEPVGDLVVRPAALRAADVLPEEIPGLVDELPALAIAQAVASGRSTVRGAGELRVKESDRIDTVIKGLRSLGATAHEREDGWDIEGGELSGGRIETRGDHRIGMAFGMASLRAGTAVTVTEGEMIDTSYPRFYSDLRDRVTSR